jgi:hypothetical protein
VPKGDLIMCKIWYLISRTVSDDDAHCGDMMIARSALSPSSPRLRRVSWASRAFAFTTARSVSALLTSRNHIHGAIESVLVRLPSCFNSQAYRIMVTGRIVRHRWRLATRPHRTADV